MGNKVKIASQGRIVKSNCRHYWVIDSPKGPTSRGVCKLCGAEKEFQNFMPDSLWKGDQSFHLGFPPGTENIEPDREQDNS